MKVLLTDEQKREKKGRDNIMNHQLIITEFVWAFEIRKNMKLRIHNHI